jgi:hypothetical protein
MVERITGSPRGRQSTATGGLEPRLGMTEGKRLTHWSVNARHWTLPGCAWARSVAAPGRGTYKRVNLVPPGAHST